MPGDEAQDLISLLLCNKHERKKETETDMEIEQELQQIMNPLYSVLSERFVSQSTFSGEKLRLAGR